MRQKIIGLLIVIATLFGAAMPSGWAAEHTESWEEEAALLNNLLTISGEITLGAQTVSRGAYAESLASLLGYDAWLSSGSAESGFYDIYGSERTARAVAILESRGIIRGDGSGFFRPEQPITYAEAVKMLLSAMGYDIEAEEQGGFPAGYLRVAVKSGLAKGIGAGAEEPLDGETFVRLFYCALDTKILTVEKYSENEEEKELRLGDKTVLNGLLRYGSQVGVVDATKYTALYSADGLDKEQVRIGGTVYELSEQAQGVIDYLGYRVKAYFKEIDGKETVIAYEVLNNDILEIEDRDLIAFEDSVLEYQSGGKIKRVTLDRNIAVIYNGVYTDSYTPEMLLPDLGSVKLIKNGSSSGYDVILVENYKNDMVAAVNVSEEKIYQRIDTAEVLELSREAKDVLIVNDKGFDIELKDIAVNSVISVMQSKNGSYVKIVVSEKVVAGTVRGVYNSDEKRKMLTIGDEKLLVSERFGTVLPQIGSGGEFYLDFKNRIVFCINAAFSEGLHWGYLIQFGQSGFGGGIVKVLRADNLMFEYPLADKVTVNGERIGADKITACGALFNEGVLKRQAVQFGVNANNEISRIQTAAEANSPDSPIRLLTSGRKMYRGTSKTFEFSSYLKDKTVVFVVPPASKPYRQDEDFRVESIGYFVDFANYQVNVYAVGDNMSEAAVVSVVQDDEELADGISENNSMYVVAQKEQCLNEEGERVTQLTLRLGNAETSHIVVENAWQNVQRGTESGAFDIDVGDTVRFSMNKKNHINLLQLIYDASEQTYSKPNSTIINTSFNGQPAMVHCRAENRPEDSVNRVVVNTGFLTGDRALRIIPAEQFTATVIDYREDRVLVEPYTSAAQIQTLDTYGETGASRIVYMSFNGAPNCMVIYNYA